MKFCVKFVNNFSTESYLILTFIMHNLHHLIESKFKKLTFYPVYVYSSVLLLKYMVNKYNPIQCLEMQIVVESGLLTDQSSVKCWM